MRAARPSSAEIARRLAAILPELSSPAANLPEAPRSATRSTAELLAALADASAARRAEAARELGAAGAPGAPDALTALRKRLQDEDAAVRSSATIALIRLGDAALLDEMVKSLGEPSAKAAAAAAAALGVAGNQAAVPHLVAAFRTHDVGVGAAIAGALAALKDARALEPLVTALKADFVPAAVCVALGRLGDAAAAPALARALRHRDPKVRATAARALGSLAEALAPEVYSPERREKLLAALRKPLRADADRKVRLCAALALVELGEPGAGAQLLGQLDGAPRAQKRKSASGGQGQRRASSPSGDASSSRRR